MIATLPVLVIFIALKIEDVMDTSTRPRSLGEMFHLLMSALMHSHTLVFNMVKRQGKVGGTPVP